MKCIIVYSSGNKITTTTTTMWTKIMISSLYHISVKKSSKIFPAPMYKLLLSFTVNYDFNMSFIRN